MFKKIAQRIGSYLIGHKIISAIVAIALITGGYFWYQASQAGTTVTKYVIENATAGTVITSVSGSGQVQAGTTVNVNPGVSETVTKIYAKVGDHVSAGQILVQLDPTNEARSLKQAQLSLQSAQLSLAKLTEAPTTSTLQQSQNAVTQGAETFTTASGTLERDYQSGFDSLSSAFVDAQTVMAGLQSFVTGNDISKAQSNPDAYVNLMPSYLSATMLPYRDAVMSNYTAAVSAYQTNLADYHATSRSADPAMLDALFTETYHTTKMVSEAVKAIKSLLDYTINNYPKNQGLAQLPTVTNTFQTNMGNYTNTISNDVTSLANVVNTISSDKTAIENDKLSLQQSQTQLAELLAGADVLSVQSQQLSIDQANLSLETAQTQLANTSVRAPIAGVVSQINAVVGETATSPAVVLVGEGEIAQVTLDEVDAANVAVGNPATLTFDAVDSLSLAGTVTQVSPVGSVSQGVVSYAVQVGFSQPSGTSTVQIKPGMSVTAEIVTKVHQNVIAVPSAALVKSGSSTYILEPTTSLSTDDIATSATGGIILNETPKRVPVTVGLVGDSMTEITSGVNEGDQIITQTIKSSSAAKTTSTTGGSSVLRLLGGGGGGGTPAGGAVRAGGAATGR